MDIEKMVEALMQAGRWSSRYQRTSKVKNVDVIRRQGDVRLHLDFYNDVTGEVFGETLVFPEEIFERVGSDGRKWKESRS